MGTLPFSNVIGHDVRHTGSNESKLNDEGIEIRRGGFNDVTENICPKFFTKLFRLLRGIKSAQKVIAVASSSVRMTNY